MILKNEKGSVIIASAVFMAVLAGLIYFYSTMHMMRVTKQYRSTQSMAYAHQIAASLAQNLRWAYDAGRATSVPVPTNLDSSGNPIPDPNNAKICTDAGGTIQTVPGSVIRLCLVNRKICTPHPGNPNQTAVCIGLDDATIIAKAMMPELRHRRKLMVAWLFAPEIAMAQGYSPPPPAFTDTNNNLSSTPPLQVKCDGVIADCLTFKFCPLLGGNCDASDPKDWVFQTVAFLKD